jgi:putative PIN family toxin of toxin-antitoxin system
MIRVVLDTNILVSALLNRHGAPGLVFRMMPEDPDMQLFVTGDVYAEYDEVLRRPKLKRGEIEIEGMLRSVREDAIWVKPAEDVKGCADPDDDVFLACAQGAKAHFLVTGNTRHFPKLWEKTRVVTAREFLDLAG